MRHRVSLLGLLGGTLTLMSCAEQDILSYQGRLPQTALECDAAYQEARSRGSYQPTPTTSAGVYGAAIGKGLATGMIKSAYQQCLARVAAQRPQPGYGAAPVTPVAVPTPDYRAGVAPSTAPVSGSAAGCTRYSPPLVGGGGYCVHP
jgi:hypothetical protein